MADLQIVNNKCNVSDRQLAGLEAEANQLHAQALSVVDHDIRTIAVNASDEAQQKTLAHMQALLASGVMGDGIHVVRGVCSRLAKGLAMPGGTANVDLSRASSSTLNELRKALK